MAGQQDGGDDGGDAAGDGAGNGAGSGRQLIAVVILLVALVGVGWWLTGALRGTAAIQDCVMAGRTNCAPAR